MLDCARLPHPTVRFTNKKYGLVVLVNDDRYATQMLGVINWRIVDAHLGLQPIG